MHMDHGLTKLYGKEDYTITLCKPMNCKKNIESASLAKITLDKMLGGHVDNSKDFPPFSFKHLYTSNPSLIFKF